MAAPIRFNVIPDARGLHINRPNINNVGRAYMYFSVDIDRFSVSDGDEWLNPDDYDPGTLMTRLGYTVPSPSIGGGLSIGDSITGGDPGAVLTIDSLGNLSEGNNLIFTDIPTKQFVVGDATSLTDFGTVASLMNTLFNSQGLTLFNTANTSIMNLDGINTTYFKANGSFDAPTATVIGDDLWGMFWTGLSDPVTQAIAATLRVTALDNFVDAPATRFKLTVLDPASDILLSANDTNVLYLTSDTFSDALTFSNQVSTNQFIIAGGFGASTVAEFTDAGTFSATYLGNLGLSIFSVALNNTVLTIDGLNIDYVNSNNTFADPTATLFNDFLGTINWYGLDDALALTLGASITVRPNADFMSTDGPTYMHFFAPSDLSVIQFDVSNGAYFINLSRDGITLNANTVTDNTIFATQPLTSQFLIAGGAGASTITEFTNAGTFYADNIGRLGLSVFDTNNTIVTSIDGNAITHIKANGGFTSPTQVLNGDSLGGIDWWGLDDSTSLVLAAKLTVSASENFVSGARSSAVRLQAPGTTGSIELDVSGQTVSLFIKSTGIELNTNKLHIGAIPTSDPHILGDLWNNSGVLTVSAG